MLILIFVGLIIVLVIAMIIGAGRNQERYAKMTEEEFEAEAQRGSPIGAAMLTTHNILSPHHHVEHLQQQDKHLEAERGESGDRPKPGDPKP